MHNSRTAHVGPVGGRRRGHSGLDLQHDIVAPVCSTPTDSVSPNRALLIHFKGPEQGSENDPHAKATTPSALKTLNRPPAVEKPFRLYSASGCLPALMEPPMAIVE